MSKITIAIDGYSSCGKSTLAKELAAKLSYTYIDSGAMYRAVALYAIQNGIIRNGEVDKKKLIDNLDNIDISFQYDNESQKSHTYLNGKNVESEIREMPVSRVVSKVSLIKEVRRKMVYIQHELGKKKGVVMDGRDIGTVVFPDAELKIFMWADAEVRAKRRYDELVAKGIQITMDEVRENLRKRDHEDTTREENPLKQAPDAIPIDNTYMTQDEQFTIAYKHALRKITALAEKKA